MWPRQKRAEQAQGNRQDVKGLFHGEKCKIVIFQNGKVMVSGAILLSKATHFLQWIAI